MGLAASRSAPAHASLSDALTPLLADLDARDLRRIRRTVEGPQGVQLRVDGRDVLSFCSNDYLGLANHPALIEAACDGARRYGVGGGASHLISGHSAAHEAAEGALAAFVGAERALLFSSGYMANLGIVPALVGRGDAVFSDQLNHACIVDAARLSRAEVHVYPHADVEALERLLAASDAKRKLVATDAVFSMDGDIAPLQQLAALCEQYRAWLMVDDAHGFGVLGPQGRGTPAHLQVSSPNLVYMGTLGKAAGVAGAFAAGSADLIEWLVQRARTYVFTTASPPLLAVALVAALRLIETEAWRRERLAALIRLLREGVSGTSLQLPDSPTPIQPLITGDNRRALKLAARLLERGIWVPAIRPPTVPCGTARLRVSLSAAHEPAYVERLVDALRS